MELDNYQYSHNPIRQQKISKMEKIFKYQTGKKKEKKKISDSRGLATRPKKLSLLLE